MPNNNPKVGDAFPDIVVVINGEEVPVQATTNLRQAILVAEGAYRQKHGLASSIQLFGVVK